MATNNIATVDYVAREQGDAKYDVEAKRFRHSIDIFSNEPFKLQKIVLRESGPYEGSKTYIAVRDTYFAFQKTSSRAPSGYLQVRLWDRNSRENRPWIPKRMERTQRCDERNTVFMVRKPAKQLDHALLLTCRAISIEAKEFLYSDHQFIFDTMSSLERWLGDIGSSTKHLTHLELTKTTPQVNRGRSIYGQLANARNLKYLCITLPTTVNGSLKELIDKHWELLKAYLVTSGSVYIALARLKGVHFCIDKSHKGVLDDNGTRMREITPTQNEWCRQLVRDHVRSWINWHYNPWD